jgi:hypothetical protein
MKLTNILKIVSSTLFLGLGMVLASCSASPIIPTETPTRSVTETPTATIVWFPPTNTPTSLPSALPAPIEDYHPGLGAQIFSDSFDQPDLWNTSDSAQASASVSRNRLILSINDPGPLSILTLRNQPVLGDFYAEASVDLSLCGGQDQYGFIYRASSISDFYRYVINCSGQVRVERVRGGVSYPLLGWLSSGDAPTGAPAQVTLGVWAVGAEMRFFLNDHFQFSQTDPVFSSGTLGFFVYANGNTPVTISFSNLSVYSVSYTPPPATPSPTQTPTNEK